MQLLLSTVYQQAKKTDRNVERAIDEAHYLFEDQANLDFLETAFRHQRHAGLRMVLLSQTAQEFYETDQTEKILGMCPIKVFHKLPDLDDETADKIGLTREQRQYVRGADAGRDESNRSRAYLTEKNRLLTDRVDELEATLEQKNERIDTLEAEIERLTAELADRDREEGHTHEEQAVTASESDDESETASVWGRTKRLFGNGSK